MLLLGIEIQAVFPSLGDHLNSNVNQSLDLLKEFVERFDMFNLNLGKKNLKNFGVWYHPGLPFFVTLFFGGKEVIKLAAAGPYKIQIDGHKIVYSSLGHCTNIISKFLEKLLEVSDTFHVSKLFFFLAKCQNLLKFHDLFFWVDNLLLA